MLRRPLFPALSSPSSPWRNSSLYALHACRAPPSILCRPFSATDLAASSRRARFKKLRAAKEVASKNPGISLKEALLGFSTRDFESSDSSKSSESEPANQDESTSESTSESAPRIKRVPSRKPATNKIQIHNMDPADLNFQPIQIDDPPAVPMLAYGLDRVLFNPGVYRLQDPRSRVYNFDPYLEKIMPVNEFNFDALTEYKTSSKDHTLLEMTRKQDVKYTGSTSSMSGIMQHLHFLLSSFRLLNHDVLSKAFPDASRRFSKITYGPSAVFLRYKDGVYAIDADKRYDTPNVMSWLGNSMEKLLTSDRGEFERFRRSNPDTPAEDDSGRCFHYTKQGKMLMRSQLDAHDPRLPGTGVFDLKTRAVVSIRMNAKEYEEGTGYQLRYARGEWESFEREFYDMTRATLLKYLMQVRMGRMDGIFIAFHNIEQIFGFQYLSLPDMDQVIHGQHNKCLGDQEFQMSVALIEELMERATAKFPKTTLRLHFEARPGTTPFMYCFAEPVTDAEADAIQNTGEEEQREFARKVVGLERDSQAVQTEWQNLQSKVDEEVGGSEGEEAKQDNTDELAEPESEGPLIGWTLTVRNKVNGEYVERPENLQDEDSWKIEYHIKEIGEKMLWKTYNSIHERRRQLVSTEEVSESLTHFRDLIKRYTDRGRKWREKQDKITEEKGVQVFKPLGPGSDAAKKRNE